MMDCPLNLAHLQDRRADSFLRYGRFADAIACHEKASEYLVEAMKMTQVTQALVSMKLQYASHFRQQRVLKEKWRRFELQMKLKEERAQKLKEQSNQEAQAEKSCIVTTASGDMLDGNQLNPSQTSSLVISAENFSVSSISSCSEGPAKDEQESVHIQELQMQVLSLSQALEDSNRENAKLRKTINNIKEFVQKTFGYELDEEKCPEQGIVYSGHETASIKEMELSLPDHKDIADVHTCGLLKEMESSNSSGAMMVFCSSDNKSTAEELHSEEAINEMEEHQSEDASNNSLNTGELNVGVDSFQQEQGDSDHHMDDTTLASESPQV